MSAAGGSQKKRIDRLFLAHIGVSSIAGGLALALPNVFEWFFVHHGQPLQLRDNGRPEAKVTHLLIRLYGALIVAQGVVVYHIRKVGEPAVRRGLVQAYTICFGLSSLALLRAQLTESPGITGGMNSWNWLTIITFVGLTLWYGNHAFIDRIVVFEGLGKSLA